MVVVFGFDAYDPGRVCTVNQMGVALSRAKKHLVVIHGRSNQRGGAGQPARAPHPYYPVKGTEGVAPGDSVAIAKRSADMQAALSELVGEGHVELDPVCDGRVPDVKLDANASPEPQDGLYAATDFGYFAASAEERFVERTCGSRGKSTRRGVVRCY